jgi:hypothetical protein
MLHGRPDRLTGFGTTWVASDDAEVVAAHGRRHYPALIRTGRDEDQVDGLTFAVTEAELLYLDASQFTSVSRERVMLVSGRVAWVYLDWGADEPG